MGKARAAGDGPTAPLLGSSGVFETANRPARDLGWLAAFALLFVASSVGGMYSFLHRNTNFAELVSVDHLNDPANCPIPRDTSLLDVSESKGDPLQLDKFIKTAAYWILAGVGGSFLLGIAFLFLVRHHARLLVWSAITLQVTIPAAAATVLVYQNATSAAIPLVILTLLTAWLFILWRDQVKLVIKLVAVAGHGLIENSGLVGMAVLLQLGLAVALVPMLLSMIAAAMNGKVVYNEGRAQGDVDMCIDDKGRAVMCCVWQLDPWVPPYLALASATLLWTTFLAFEIKVYTVAGTVAQWYFAPVSSANSRQGSRTLRAFKYAVGPSLGSLCLASAIMTWVSLLRQMMESIRKRAESNVFIYCLFIGIQFMFTFMEFLTKFTTVRMAISGEAFLSAARNVVDLLKRNFLDAFGVWWLPPLILQSCSFLVSAGWAMLMFCASYLIWEDQEQGKQSAILLAIICFAASWAVLSFFCSLLLNLVDALFVCFAIDRDMRACTHPEVHEVYSQLPTVGQVVENPDGNYAYAAPIRANMV